MQQVQAQQDGGSHPIHRYPAHLVQSLRLPCGAQVTVRPVLPQDAALECEFVAALSAGTRRYRFHGAISGLSADRAARMTNIDYQREMALVAVVVQGQGEEQRETLIADARYVARGHTAEFAVVVADAWAGRGLASRLMNLLAECARRAGLRWLRGEVLAANARMLALMQRLGFGVTSHDDDDVVVVERTLGAVARAAAAQPTPGWWAALVNRLLPWSALTAA